MGGLLYCIIVGVRVGCCAREVMKGGGYGVLMDIVLGMLGAIVGGWLFGMLGISTGGLIGGILVAFIGAVILIWLTRMLKKA